LLKVYSGAAWVTIYDYGNSRIPPSAVPNDYVLSAMLNSSSGSEAVTEDVIRDGAVTGDKLGATAIEDALDGTANVVSQTNMQDDSIGVAELKITSGTSSTTSTVGVLPAGGIYGFLPRIYNSSGGAARLLTVSDYWMYTTGTAVAGTFVLYSSSGTAYMTQSYIQASPPYKLGNIDWGHFYFILRNIADQEIVSSYEAEDPPWAYNGNEWNPKDSKERIQEIPHPFPEYYKKDPALDGLELVLVDLRNIDIKKLKQDSFKAKKHCIDALKRFNPKGPTKSHAEFLLPEIIGFTDKVKIKTR